MKKSIIKFWDKAIILLLFIFGIVASCDKPQPKYGMPVPMYGVQDTSVCLPEYGVPQASFKE
jgi:hypothetical protein